MREVQLTDITGTVTFPNECAFAFNPNFIVVDAASVYSVDINVSGNDKSFDITCSLNNGKAKCYISKLLQLLFDDDYLTTRVVAATITVKVGAETVSQTQNVIWGGIRLGDSFGLGETVAKNVVNFGNTVTYIKFQREVVWFTNFPFSISFFFPSTEKNLYAYYDGGDQEEVSCDKGVISEINPDSAKRHIRYDIMLDKEVLASTFPTVFDETFNTAYKYITERVDVTVRKETQGYYLRWIDQMGFIQYWLFKKSTVTHKNKLGSNTRYVLDEINGYYYSNIERTTSIENTETIKCAAINLNENMVRTVETIIKSPYIDLFLGYNQNNEAIWVPVNIVAGSHKVKPNDTLQDYEIQFTMPDTVTQSL